MQVNSKEVQERMPVSVIVTCMTDAEEVFLQECLASVIHQDHVGEIILCVEQQNSWYPSILQNFADSPITVLVLKLASVGAIRNAAVRCARYDWIAFCDADDYWLPHKLACQCRWQQKYQLDFIGCGHLHVDETGKALYYGFNRHISMPSTWLLRKKLLMEIPFHEENIHGSDGVWWRKVFHHIQKSRVPEVLVHYRVREESVSQASVPKKRKVLFLHLASIPLIRPMLLLFSWLVWQVTKQESYRWYKKWELPKEAPLST